MKTYRNEAEQKFAETARQNGWFVTKRGWPDFFCVHEDGSIMLVEVKPYEHSRPKLSQQRILDALGEAGVDVRVWNPQSGFAVRTEVYPSLSAERRR